MKKIIASTLLCGSMLFAASNYNYEVTPMIGGGIPEGNLDLENQTNYGISLGRNLEHNHVFDQVELGILKSKKDDYTNSAENTSIMRYFINGIKEYEVTDKTSFYALVGLGYEDFSNNKFENDDDGFGNYGVGLKYKLSEMIALKADVRHLITFDGDNTFLYNLGLGISFGEKAKPAVIEKEPEVMPVVVPVILDDDKDGVINSNDICPQTPMGIKVKANGCEVDSDNDGIVDSADKCPNTPAGVIVDNTGCAAKVDLHINFDFDSSKIKNHYASDIDEFATFLKKFPNVKARIEAHTDSQGAADYNKELSQKRADAAVKALTDLDINKNRLEAIGFGEDKPTATNDTTEGRASNRRVEATIKK